MATVTPRAARLLPVRVRRDFEVLSALHAPHFSAEHLARKDHKAAMFWVDWGEGRLPTPTRVCSQNGAGQIEEGDIFATINQRDGMVSFIEDPESVRQSIPGPEHA